MNRIVVPSALALLAFASLLPARGAEAAKEGARTTPRPAARNAKGNEPPPAHSALFVYQAGRLGLAIAELQRKHGPAYPGATAFQERLRALQEQAPATGAPLPPKLWAALQELKREVFLAHPGLRQLEAVLVVKRQPREPARQTGPNPQWVSRAPGIEIALPSNHECNSSLPREGHDNEIAAWDPRQPDAPLRTVHRPAGSGYVGEIDLHFDGDRLLFTESHARNWQVHEIRLDGSGPRQISRLPDDVDCYDACYLPDGRIVFGSSAPFQAVPCWHGLKVVTNLYTMNDDGTGLRRLCHDQDHDLHPAVMSNGQIVYSRWDYTGINHIFVRQLMVMNPDGTGQRAVYGSNSYFPNSLYFPRAIPGRPGEIVCILSGYHGPHRMGLLVVVDTNRGWYEADGIVQRITGSGEPLRPEVRDDLIGRDWPKFLHPYPIDEDIFLVAAWPGPGTEWGLYLADRFDNLVLLRREAGQALLEPVPVRRTARPPVIPDRTDPAATEATVYLHDIHEGPGLAGVPRGTIKSLRIVGYHFGYPGFAGPHVVGRGGPWEVMRILGTVPIEEDGSAMFRVPAGVPLSLQALDAEGKAVQLMRSWYTAMPGEKASCIGCHETPAQVPAAFNKLAQGRAPRAITPWRGPPRGFDFEREVQPVLDRHCVGCHGPDGGARPDLRPLAAFPDYRGQPPDDLGVSRMNPKLRTTLQGRHRYTPAYEALLPYIRRVNIEDDARLLTPGEYHADTSELIQRLRAGHQGVRLDAEAWDRLITWIDLNAPCHGTWADAHPLPTDAPARRLALNRLAGAPTEDFEAVPAAPPRAPAVPVVPAARPQVQPVRLGGWPLSAAEAEARQAPGGPRERTLDLGAGAKLVLRRIPAGKFVMGSAGGGPDEPAAAVVTIARPFWLAVTETSNAQYRRFRPEFDCGYYQKRHARDDDMGLPLNEARQPAVRVSWEQAMAFCAWVSARTGLNVTLPTEAQWEWACRAGSDAPFFFGGIGADFSAWANLADLSFSRGHRPDGRQVTGGLDHIVLEGADLADRTRQDGHIVTAPVGSYGANAWGLRDLIGNAAEWTRSLDLPYPYVGDDGRNAIAGGAGGRRVVRGGSFFDRPARAHAALRLAYPAWQQVFNVGFRVAVEEPPGAALAAQTLRPPPSR